MAPTSVGGGSEQSLALKTATVTSEQADLPICLEFWNLVCFLVVALEGAVHGRLPLSTVNKQISCICLEFWNPFSSWWWLWKGLFTEDPMHCHQWTSRSPLSAQSSEAPFLSGGGSEKGCSLKIATVKSKQADPVFLHRVIYLGDSEKSIAYMIRFSTVTAPTSVLPWHTWPY